VWGVGYHQHLQQPSCVIVSICCKIRACCRVVPVSQVGYMGVPYMGGDMTSHLQYVVVRNERGARMLDAVRHRLITQPTISTGDRKPLVMQVCDLFACLLVC
jgi:hypothetical protein